MVPGDVIVVSLPGFSDPSLAIAAARAGARGFVGLEQARNEDDALAAVTKADRFVAGKFGIKIGHNERLLAKKILAKPPAKLGWVLLSDCDDRDLKSLVNACAEAGVDVLWEAVSIAEARRAEVAGVAGLILKGNAVPAVVSAPRPRSF